MDRDRLGLAIALVGLLLFGGGIFVFVDIGYFNNSPTLQSIPVARLLAPNLIFGGYALIEISRYVATKAGTRESRYFGDRLNIITGAKPISRKMKTTTATGCWFWVLMLGLVVHTTAAILQFTLRGGTFRAQALYFGSIAVMVIAVHYDMEHVEAIADWGGHRRWEIGFVVFPINLAVAGAYAWHRHRQLETVDQREGDAGSSYELDGHIPPESGDVGTDEVISGNWHYLIGGCLIGWLLTLISPDVTVGSSILIGVTVIAIWLLLPLATYFDIEGITSDLWEPKRTYWVFGSLVPILNLIVGAAYLIRRYETTRAIRG